MEEGRRHRMFDKSRVIELKMLSVWRSKQKLIKRMYNVRIFYIIMVILIIITEIFISVYCITITIFFSVRYNFAIQVHLNALFKQSKKKV